MPNSRTASATLWRVCSKPNSGVWMPTTCRPCAPYSRLPAVQVADRPAAVDAGVGPEIDQHHLAAQPGERQRRRGVDPAVDAGELAALRAADGRGGWQPLAARGPAASSWRSERRDCMAVSSSVAGGQAASTSMTAWANSRGASCGRLWPMPPVISRCAYCPRTAWRRPPAPDAPRRSHRLPW